MEVDHDFSLSDLLDSRSASDAVRWAQPVPSDPHILKLKELSEQQKVRPSLGASGLSLSNISRPSTTGPRPITDLRHAARDRRNRVQTSENSQYAPFLGMATEVGKAADENARRKGKKLARTSGAHLSISSADCSRTEHLPKAARHDTPFEPLSSGSRSHSHLESSLRVSSLGDRRPAMGQDVHAPTPAPSRLALGFQSILDSMGHDVNYDYPTSTPTPPARPRACASRRASSSSSDEHSQSFTLYSNATTPVSTHQSWLSRDTSVESTEHHLSALLSTRSTSTVNGQPEDVSTESVPISAYEASSDADSVALIPRRPSLRVSPSFPPTGALSPSLTPTPTVLFRPFVSPSPAAGASQVERERPRGSQHPPPLGMRRRAGERSKFEAKSKQFRVPFAKQPTGQVLNGDNVHALRVVGVRGRQADASSSMGSGCVGKGRGNLSPIIPNPPHGIARTPATAAHEDTTCSLSGDTECLLEMSEGGLEELRMEDEEEEENKEANSSADLWIWFD